MQCPARMSRRWLNAISLCALASCLLGWTDSSSNAADKLVSASAGPRVPQHVRKVPQPATGFLSRTKSAFAGFADKLSAPRDNASNERRPVRVAKSPLRSKNDHKLSSPFQRIRESLTNRSRQSQTVGVARGETPAAKVSHPPQEIPVFDRVVPPFEQPSEFVTDGTDDSVIKLDGPASQAWYPQATTSSEAKPGRVAIGDLNTAQNTNPGRVLVGELPQQSRRPSGRVSVGRLGNNTQSAGRVSIQRLAGDDAFDRGRPKQIRIPINDAAGNFSVGGNSDRISLSVREAPLSEVLGLVAEQHGLNIVTASSVTGTISVSLAEVGLEDALDAILTVNGYTWVRQKNIILVSKLDQKSPVSHVAQGRLMRVFSLTYVAAVDIDAVVQGLLSPVGKSFVTTQSAQDKRKTQEQIVVEDLPQYISRVESYIAQADQPPRQVLIEAHILRVDLGDNLRHGVDLQGLARLSGARITLRSTGFANPAASPAFLFGVDGTDLDTLIEALQTTTDAKTLASPKVLAVNGQEARIQVGERLGYLVTTTTQTSTLQNVNFLDTGIVLTVTPGHCRHWADSDEHRPENLDGASEPRHWPA